jgi:DNA-binding NtrC family response regulator
VTRLFTTRNKHAAQLADDLGRLGVTDLPLLLEGETGTGKSVVAAALHRHSRAGEPLVIIDCGALPPSLLAGELFGHVAGAFTDATHARVGFFERAGRGTLVLDRVDTLPIEAQTALLRAVEERRFVPVGASDARFFRARVIALADAGLEARLANGALRRDLYHRLAGYHAVLPPLRRRPEDIVPAARRWLRRYGGHDRRATTLHPEAVSLLLAYPWPGNFRELEAVISRACLRLPGTEVGATDLGLAAQWPAFVELAAERALTLVEVQRLYALFVLARERGNVSRAARVLGVSRRTLIRWRAGA